MSLGDLKDLYRGSARIAPYIARAMQRSAKSGLHIVERGGQYFVSIAGGKAGILLRRLFFELGGDIEDISRWIAVLAGTQDDDPRDVQEAAVRRFLETMPMPEPIIETNAREFNLALQYYARTTKRSLRSILLGAGVGVASKVGARGRRSQNKNKPHGSGILAKSLQPTSRLLERNSREWLMEEVESTSKRWQKYKGKTITRIQIFMLAHASRSKVDKKAKIFKNKSEARKEARKRSKVTQSRRAYYAAGFMQAAEDLSLANKEGKNFKNPYRVKKAGYGVPPKSKDNPEIQIVHTAPWATRSAVQAVEQAIAKETREKVRRIEKRLDINWQKVKVKDRI